MESLRTQWAAAIWIANAYVVASVLPIFMLGTSVAIPPIFFIVEGIILVLLSWFVFDPAALTKIVANIRPAQSEEMRNRFAGWRDRTYPVVIGLTFILQYVALTPLLLRTGGPINSPFVVLAFAYAVCFSALANQLLTVFAALGATLVYYITLVAVSGHDLIQKRPDDWVFSAVMAVSLGLIAWLLGLARLYESHRRNGEVNDPTGSIDKRSAERVD